MASGVLEKWEIVPPTSVHRWTIDDEPGTWNLCPVPGWNLELGSPVMWVKKIHYVGFPTRGVVGGKS